MRSIHLVDLLMGFSRALELVKPNLNAHNVRVAYLAQRLANGCAIDRQEKKHLLIASMLHEIGTIPMEMGTGLMWEMQKEKDYCVAGWVFCRTARLPEAVCNMVLLRQMAWHLMDAQEVNRQPANCLHLADSLDRVMRNAPQASFSSVVQQVMQKPEEFSVASQGAIGKLAGDAAAVHSLKSHADMVRHLSGLFREDLLSTDKLLILCDLFSQIIDSKSPFTATHSHGVAHTAREILQLTGLASQEDCLKIYIAGLLHDIGKLAVPTEILEKPGALTADEHKEIRRHAAVGLEVLASIPGFKCVRDWGGMHHERLNGQGYPLGLKGDALSLPMRIMAVADVFTALTENRPYRKGMNVLAAIMELWRMAKANELDRNIIALVAKNALRLNEVRIRAQRDATARFVAMRRSFLWSCG